VKKTDPNLKNQYLLQIKAIKKRFKKYTIMTRFYLFPNDDRIMSLRTRIITIIHRITGKQSDYSEEIDRILQRSNFKDFQKVTYLMGPLDALYKDIQNDCLDTLSELIHGSMFTDYLEMSEHLLNEGYKDAAAVMTGSTLEQHLRKLCQKVGIDVKVISGKPKKADSMNSELAKQRIFNKIEQKQITTWLGIRNDAAHGNYNAYTTDQVNLFIMGLRDFLDRHPA